MTKRTTEQQRARELQKSEGISYTAALARVRAQQDQDQPEAAEPLAVTAPPRSPYARDPFHPSCSVRTDFAGLQEGDRIDYWGTPRPVIDKTDCAHGRVRVLVTNEHGGRDFALGPGDEPVWRMRRPHERAPESRVMAHRRAYPWSPCDDCTTRFTCEEQRDIDRCP